jgi:hypothetical protein
VVAILYHASSVQATPLYFLPGFAQDGGRWAFFCLIIILQDLCVSVQYRSFTWASPNQEMSMIISSGYIAVGLSTGGYFLLVKQVGWWLRWMIYVSPFFWSTTAVGCNEFGDSKYDVTLPDGQTKGQAFMSSFDFPFSDLAKWGGAAILLLYYLVLGLVVQPRILQRIRYECEPGTKRDVITDAVTVSNDDNEEDEIVRVDTNNIGHNKRGNNGVAILNPFRIQQKSVEMVSTNTTSDKSAPATGVTLVQTTAVAGSTYVFHNITYSVPVKPARSTADAGADAAPVTSKKILQGVSGFALPGSMTALMGPSGGKCAHVQI